MRGSEVFCNHELQNQKSSSSLEKPRPSKKSVEKHANNLEKIQQQFNQIDWSRTEIQNPVPLNANLYNKTIFPSLPQTETSTYQVNNVEQNPWIIIVFSDFNYIPVTTIWYTQMNQLGYTNHRIYVLDHEAYKFYSNNYDNQGNPYRVYYPAHDPNDLIINTVDNKHGQGHQEKLSHIWQIRLKCVNTLIHQNFNVMQSDVDAIWAKYVDLTRLPTNVDGFYGLGLDFPKDAYKKWNLVLHGGLFAYYSNQNTKKFWQHISENCDQDCDDQKLINGYLKNYYKIQAWDATLPDSEFPFESHVAYGHHEDGSQLTLMTFAKRFVIRGFGDLPCQTGEWIISPNASKKFYHKLYALNSFAHCYQAESRKILAESIRQHEDQSDH